MYAYTGRVEYLWEAEAAERRVAEVRARLARPVVGFDTEWVFEYERRVPPSRGGLIGSQPGREHTHPTALVQIAADVTEPPHTAAAAGAIKDVAAIKEPAAAENTENTDPNVGVGCGAGSGAGRGAGRGAGSGATARTVSSRTVLLVHLSRIGGLPLSLRILLEDAGVIKVGFLSHNDTAKLEPEYGVKVRNLADLADLAGRCRAEWAISRFSLARLCQG